MVTAEAKQLGDFRRIIERAELLDLVPIINTALDDCVDLLRRTAPPSVLIEMVAALSAELHKRRVEVQAPGKVGAA
jgi:hypothetical protein